MRRFLTLPLIAAATVALAGAPGSAGGSRSALDERGRPVPAAWADTGRFESLTAAGMDDVRFSTGSAWRIRATGDPRAVEQLRFLVEDGKLVVGRIKGPRERFGKVQVDVTAPAIEGATAAGSGSLSVDRLSGPRAGATLAGSGSIDVADVATERLDATIAGSGVLRLSGRSETAKVTIAGSGDFDAERFATGDASVTVAGSGDARFRSAGKVQATIMGSGTVTVTGGASCTQTRTGSGRLTCSG